MRKAIIFSLSILLCASCSRPLRIYTYYCKEIDYTFKIVEKDTCDVLVLADGDSVFYYRPYNGGYCGIEFFLSVDSNRVYFGPEFPTVYCYKENKYKFEFIVEVEDDLTTDVYEPFEAGNYWGFYGGCDRGCYTFGIRHKSKDYGSIEPLEWKR